MKKAVIFCSFFIFFEASASPEEKINQALFKSYIAVIKNSVGARTFRQLYLYDKDADRVVEVLQNGNLACAYFASSVLHHFELIKNYHDSIKDMVEDMKKSGWRKIDHPIIGSVIVWSARTFRKNSKPHKHIGFYVGSGRVISMSSKRGYPVMHGLNDERRKIEEILFYPSFYEMKGGEK